MGLTALIVKLLIHIWPFLKETILGGNRVDLFVRRNKWVIVLAFTSILFLFIYSVMLDGLINLSTKLNASQERVLFLERQAADNERYKIENVALQKLTTDYALELARVQALLKNGHPASTTVTTTTTVRKKPVQTQSINTRLLEMQKPE